MNLTQIVKEVKDSIKSAKWTDKEIGYFLNKSIDYLHSYCPICKEKMSNWKGVRIHVAKKHGLSVKNIVNETIKNL